MNASFPPKPRLRWNGKGWFCRHDPSDALQFNALLDVLAKRLTLNDAERYLERVELRNGDPCFIRQGPKGKANTMPKCPDERESI